MQTCNTIYCLTEVSQQTQLLTLVSTQMKKVRCEFLTIYLNFSKGPLAQLLLSRNPQVTYSPNASRRKKVRHFDGRHSVDEENEEVLTSGTVRQSTFFTFISHF